MQDSGCGLPRRPQVVEKVVVGPIGSLEQPQNTSKPAQNTTKPGFKALERGSETSTRGFFNTLGRSRKSVYRILHSPGPPAHPKSGAITSACSSPLHAPCY